ncbi:unnamed protein product, partial [Discosporangium mesarthrocarpum]
MCLAFLLVYAKLRRDVVMLEELADRENVTPSDYAVVVTGLPEDAQDEEVIDHFSSLFRLDQPGWKHDGWGCGCCRMGVKRADRPEHVVDYWGKSIGGMLDPVDSTEHSRFDHLCLNSWLAECSLAHPEGAFIRQARRLKRISRDILQARAAIKRYAEGTPRVGGANRVLRRKAEARLATLQKELELGAEKMESKATSFERTSWKTHAAYIIFNYETSFWRCIHDYGRYPAWLQPRQLRFRGRHRLTVKRAPEPGNIQWENLEESQRQRGGRKLVTALVTLLLLAFSFGVIYLTRIAENSYSSEDSPTEKTCLIDIPGLHGLDEGTPFIGEDSHPLGSSACPDGAHWVSLEGSPYQTPGQPDQCVRPCININEGNELMECGDGALFSPADIGKCFCRQEMKEALKDEWLFEYMLNQRKGQCREFALDYLWEKVVSILASVNVVIINEGLKRVLKKMGTFERSRSVTSRDISVTWKISLALFINSACVVLLVNTPLSFWVSIFPYPLHRSQRVQTRRVGHTWYTSTGKYLVITMTIQTFAPQLPALIYYAIVGPIKRRMAFVALTQQQLNKHWECPRFDLSSRLPFTLMVTAVTMMFSPALPILQPVALVYLIITYFMDKFLLLNMYKKPPHNMLYLSSHIFSYSALNRLPATLYYVPALLNKYDSQVAMFAIRTMPWMLALHLGFALWTYSEPTVFDSGYVGDLLRTEDDVEVGGAHRSQDPSGVISRSLRTNCFPFMVLLALLAGLGLLKHLFGDVLQLMWSVLSCRCLRMVSKVKPLATTESIPPYTGEFRMIFSRRDGAPQQFNQGDGWVSVPSKDGRFLHIHRARNPDSKAHTGGVMLTWEVLRDLYNLHTYHIEDNEAYRDIVISRNMIAKARQTTAFCKNLELEIITPKSPGGKLWSPEHYRDY